MTYKKLKPQYNAAQFASIKQETQKWISITNQYMKKTYALFIFLSGGEET